MSELSINERLKLAQQKAKNLAASREQIVGDLRVEEQKLKQAYDNLRALGVENPETKSVAELTAMANEFKSTLAENLTAIETQLAKGEELMRKYRELQES